MARFMEMVEEFKTLPPMHEIARCQILMPGDKGYKKTERIDPGKVQRAMGQMIQPSGPEPEWMRQRRLRMERQKKSGLTRG